MCHYPYRGEKSENVLTVRKRESESNTNICGPTPSNYKALPAVPKSNG